MLPASQRRVSEELYHLGLGVVQAEGQYVNFTGKESLRIFDFVLQCHPAPGGGLRVERRRLNGDDRGAAASPPVSAIPAAGAGGSLPPRTRGSVARQPVRAATDEPSDLSGRTRLPGRLRSFGAHGWQAPPPADPMRPFGSTRTKALGNMPYAVYLPPGRRSDKAYPMVVFLHGYGERGEDGRLQLKAGLGPFISGRLAAHLPPEFIAFFPQSYSGQWQPDSEDGILLMEAIEKVQAPYRVDPGASTSPGYRLAGWPSGGWPPSTGKWAAIVPMGGTFDPVIAATIWHIPCWCFYGGADSEVNPRAARAGVEALRRHGGKPLFTELPDRHHDFWITAYSTPGLFDWLLSQELPSAE